MHDLILVHGNWGDLVCVVCLGGGEVGGRWCVVNGGRRWVLVEGKGVF